MESCVSLRPAWLGASEPWGRALGAVLPTFLLTRLVFLMLTYFGVVLFALPNYASESLPGEALLYSWYRWDAVRFGTIAANGYVKPEYTAFFPLYPIAERIISIPLGDDVYVAGILISNLAFLGALTVLYRFVETEFDGGTAGRATLYLAVFPTAFFFFTAYNESLFLLLTLLSFYTMRRALWWQAGMFAGLASLTRSAGLLLLPIFVYEFLRQRLPYVRELQRDWQPGQYSHALRELWHVLPALLILLGPGAYAGYLNLAFHDPLAFVHAQSLWRTGPSPPWYAFQVIIDGARTSSPLTFAVSHGVIDLAAVLLLMTLLVLCFLGPVRFDVDQWSLAMFGLLVVVFALTFPGRYETPLASMERFALEVFAAFILLARLARRPRFHQWYLVVSLPMLGFLTLQFLTDHWTV
jgi:Gpi18-like mannosyltransferase